MSSEACSQLGALRLVIDSPVPDTDGRVVAMPMAPFGYLCSCRVTATPPEIGAMSLGIRGVIKPVGSVRPSIEEMFSACPGGAEPTGNPNEWEFRESLLASAEDNPTANNNKLFVAATWFKMTGPSEIPPEFADVEFRGRRVLSCTRPIESVLTPAVTNLPDITPKEVGPKEVTDQVLEYRDLSVTNFSLGNRLMRHGEPLYASRIAVSAFNVEWRYGQVIPWLTKPLGEFEPATIGWSFQGLPKGAIVIWQGDVRRKRVVSSEHPDAPDIMVLDPSRPIYVQVNYAFADIRDRAGSFGLRVRVID